MSTAIDADAATREFEKFLWAKLCLEQGQQAEQPKQKTVQHQAGPRLRNARTVRRRKETVVAAAERNHVALADIVLSATTARDLQTALDEALCSEVFQERFALLPAQRGLSSIAKHPMGPSLETMTQREILFGADAAKALAVTDALWMQIARFVAQFPQAPIEGTSPAHGQRVSLPQLLTLRVFRLSSARCCLKPGTASWRGTPPTSS